MGAGRREPAKLRYDRLAAGRIACRIICRAENCIAKSGIELIISSQVQLETIKAHGANLSNGVRAVLLYVRSVAKNLGRFLEIQERSC